MALGVADGVGGWIQYGINSSKFSNELMRNCHREVTNLYDCEEESDENSEYDLFNSCEGSNNTEIESVSSENNSTPIPRKSST